MSEKKNLQIEYIRAIAAIGVVAIHTIYSGILYSGETTVSYVVLFFTMIKNMLYWAVPCFGMISGILLLNPEKDLSLKKIYGQYLVRIIIVLLLFGTGFSWIEIVFNEHTISLKQIPEAFLLVLKHQTWEHLWYLYALLTVYAALPIWRYLVKRCNNVVLIVTICILYLLTAVLNSREIALHLFVLMGELFRRKIIELKERQRIIGLLLSSIIILTIVYVHEECGIDLNWLLGYTSVFVAIQSYFLFTILYKCDFDRCGNRMKKIMIELSSKSFGIYIIHMFFVNLEYKVLNLHLMNTLASAFIFIILIAFNVAISYVVTMVMGTIPGLKKII